MSIGIDRLSVQESGVLTPRGAIGIDFGLVTPREKLGSYYIHPNDVGDLPLGILDTLDKLLVRAGEV